MLISNSLQSLKINNNYCFNKQFIKSNNSTDTFQKSNLSFTGIYYRHQGLCGTSKECAWAIQTPIEWLRETVRNGKIAEADELLPVSFLQLLKAKLALLLSDRNFSPKLIKYVKSFTNEHNFETLLTLAQDECCHSSTIKRAACFTNKHNKSFAEYAANMKDYDAFERIYDIDDFSKIKDMRSVHTKAYRPEWDDIQELSPQELLLEKAEVEKLLKDRNFNLNDIDYVKSFMDDETVKIIKTLAKDKDCPCDMIRWASGYANIENEELMRYAISKKDYDAIYKIEDGRIRSKAEIDARQSKRNHSSSQTSSSNCSSKETKKGWTKEQFVKHIEEVLSVRNFTTKSLKDTEVRNLAKLLGTTPEQIRNMDKDEYRRLAIKYHPDKVTDIEEDYFRFVNALYNGK